MSVDSDLVLVKAASVRRHLDRLTEKCNVDVEAYLKDMDRQEIVLFNLQMAVQNCVEHNVVKVEDVADQYCF